MQILTTIGLVILGIIIVIGIVRVSFTPWKGFTNFLIEVMLLDEIIAVVFNYNRELKSKIKIKNKLTKN